MKLRILSDLHIEFHPFVIPKLADDDQTVLILAGDIGVIYRRDELESFLRAAACQFRAVIYVLGNHEYYRGVWPGALDTLRTWALPDNVHILERQTLKIDDIVFVGATLWSDFFDGDASVMQNAQQTLNDFHYIRSCSRAQSDSSEQMPGVTPQEILDEFRQTLAWLERTLQDLHERKERCVLVTHHGVSLQSIHETYQGNLLNGAFVSDCSRLFHKTSPALAVHGHVHNSFDYLLDSATGATRVVVNPRGYTQRDDTQENPAFDPCLVLEI